MLTPVSVSFSGPALSFLLYENSKCRFQQEGFLLGEFIHRETKTITDNEQQQINITETIKINSVLPCPQSHFFYEGSGKLDEEKLTDLLGSHRNKVVAWYKYQCTGNLKFTLRDNIIHSQLMNYFGISPELFTCCLLFNEISDDASTHTYTQTFLRVVNQRVDRVSVSIPNLSEPNNCYKNSEPASETFKKIISDLKINRRTTQGSVVINRIQNSLQKHINSVIQELSESEKYMHKLEQEVQELQQSLKFKMENQSTDEDKSESENSERPKEGCIDSTPSESESSPEVIKKSRRANNVRGRLGKRAEIAPKESRKHSKNINTSRALED